MLENPYGDLSFQQLLTEEAELLRPCYFGSKVRKRSFLKGQLAKIALVEEAKRHLIKTTPTEPKPREDPEEVLSMRQKLYDSLRTRHQL